MDRKYTGPSIKRRDFLVKVGTTTGIVLSCPARILSRDDPQEGARPAINLAQEISPTESLMRWHGLLHRILLIYEEVQSRMNVGRDFPPETLITTATMVRRFVENYHNDMEQGHLFPRFEKADKLVKLVRLLWEQHSAGRLLTGYIMNNVAPSTLEDPEKKKLLTHRIELFVRMYRAHAAFEDTVLFPAYQSVVSEQEFINTGKQMERRAQALFGSDGFNEAVEAIAEQEKNLSIYDLSQFTPAEG